MSQPGHLDHTVLVALLGALGDLLPAARAPRWEREGTRGLRRTVWRQCPVCTDGRQHRGSSWVQCPRCRGAAGWWTDPYDATNQPVRVAAEEPMDVVQAAYDLCHMTLRDLDAAIAGRPERDLMRPRPAWQLHIEAVFPHLAHRHALILVATYMADVPIRCTAADCTLALDDLAALLGPAFRSPGWAREQALNPPRLPPGRGRHSMNPQQRQARDHEVTRLRKAGWGAAAIGRRLGVDRRTVDRILHNSRRPGVT